MGKTASNEEIDYRRRLGKVIVQLREATAMSQATLSERINRSEAAVSRWETGKATPTAYDLRQLARTFDLPHDVLDMLIYPPAVYGPVMERLFGAIGDHLGQTAFARIPDAVGSGVAEGMRRHRVRLGREGQSKLPQSPPPRSRDTAAERG